MDTAHHIPVRSRTNRLVRAVGVLTIVAVAFALVGGLVAPGPEPGHAPHERTATLISATPAAHFSTTGHGAPRPPRPLMGPRLRAAENSQNSSAQAANAATIAGQPPAADPLSSADADPERAASVFTLFASRASRTRGQPVLG